MKSIALALASILAAGCASEPDRCAEPGMTCIYAGDGERGFNKDTPNAHRLDSKLYYPEDVTFGPDGRAYIVDWNNHRVRRVEKDDSLRVVIGTDYEGDGPPEMEDRLPLCNPAGAPATTVAMNHMTDVEFGPDGLLYVATWHNNKIRVFDPATDIMTSLATGVVGNVGDGGPAVDAQFGFETGTTPEPSGGLAIQGRTLYVADSLNHRIRRIDLDTGVVDCIGGTGQPGYTGDGGQALDATFNYPVDIEVGPDGRLYIADRDNHVIRAIDLATGLVGTVAGSGARCETARGACPAQLPALEMPLNLPYGVAFDAPGNMYIADTHNNRILKVTR